MQEEIHKAQLLYSATGHTSLFTLLRFSRANGFYIWTRLVVTPIYFLSFRQSVRQVG